MMNAQDNQLAQVTKSLKTSSAVVPSLLLALICIPSGILAAHLSIPPLQFLFMGLVIIPVILVMGQIIFFTVYDRDRLQNEEHVERKMLIGRMSAELGDSNGIIEIRADAKLVGNPSSTVGD